MTTPIITVENLSKRYHLGQIGATTLRESTERFLSRIRLRKTLDHEGKTLDVRHETLDRGGTSVPSSGSLKSNVQGLKSLPPSSGSLTSNVYSLKSDDPQDLWALKDVSFEVQPGEVLGIIGRNGAGKSTLLKILSRITEPTSGRAIIRGRVASLLEVGTGFHPELTGRENIFLNGAILGMKKVEITRRFDEIVAFAEVDKFIDTPVKRYSSGMYVRLAFAVAAHLEPEILIVDEVLAVGDAGFQKKCLGKMKDVSGEGRTVLFVSHNMDAIQQLCDAALLLRSGTVVVREEPSQVVSRYLTDTALVADGVYDLTNHPARHVRFRDHIQRVCLKDNAGNVVAQFDANTRFEAVLTIITDRVIRNPRLALAIEDAAGRRLFTVASYFGSAMQEIRDHAEVSCIIPQLRLGTGRYLFSVSISTVHDGLLDSIDCAGWFEVRWNNSFGNGEPYSPHYGPILCDSIWDVAKQK